MKNILLVCYGFPPNPGIGGRRWAKFAKYLSNKGYIIDVIACENVSENTSPWQKDIENDNIKVHFLPILYPKAFLRTSKNLFEKIQFHLTKFFYKYSQRKRIYDKSFLWEKQFLQKAEEVIVANKVQNLIVTGAPFYLLYYAAKLKLKFPYLNYIADYRDPWLGAVNYGMANISAKKMELEIEMQRFVYKNVNFITAPNSFLLDMIKKSIGENIPNNKFLELEHAYDIDDLKKYLSIEPTKIDQKINFVYGGALYMGTENTLIELSNFLCDLKKNNPIVYNRVSFDFYTTEKHYAKFFNSHRDTVKFYDSIGEKIFEKIAMSHFCLLFLADHNKDYGTTKFYEYLPFKKPYLLFGEKGYVSELIQNKNLGWYFENGSIAKTFLEFLNQYDNNLLKPTEKIDTAEYSFERITDKLINILV